MPNFLTREVDRRRQQREQQPMTDEERARRCYEAGLQSGVFLRQRGELGPVIVFVPLGVMGSYDTTGMDQPDATELWKLAEIAIDGALTLAPQSFKDDGRECFALGLKAIWPEIQKGLMAIFEHGTDGGVLRSWLEAEGDRRAAERVWSVRETARREGLRQARTVLRDLVRGLTLDDPSSRAMILTQHHRDLADVLT